MRRTSALLIGTEGGIFLSAVHDKKYLEHRLSLIGKTDPSLQPKPLSEEAIQRFTTSIGSPEFLFNKEAGTNPSNIVDEATNVPIGSTQPNPVRYGDWESNGRCHDF